MRKHVVVIGGSVSGLGAGIALSQDGHRVTILERDATPMPPTAIEAFEGWDRRGSPQTRHSHAFLARLHNLLRDRAPDLFESLLHNGAEQLRFEDMVRKNYHDPELVPEDDDITLLAIRRITFEWVLRRHVLDGGLVDFRDGVEVTGLAAEPGDPPRVTGVQLARRDGSSERLDADLVLDASGRRSKLDHWLRAIGAGELEQESEPCGIFYSSRFYRLRDGAEAPLLGGVMGGDLGYMKFGIFPGDHGIFSITLCASPDDPPLRSLLKTPAFEKATAALPALREWVDPEISQPISDVHGMGNLKNTRRFFVREGKPMALGVYPVGDALIHTNPLNGRGCTLAWVNVFAAAEELTQHANDPREFALALDARVERELVPWYASTRSQDRDAIEVIQAQQRGEDPYALERPDGTNDPKAYMRSLLREGLLPAMGEDLVLLRSFMRVFNLLEAPQDLMKDPTIFQRVLAAWNRRGEREPVVHGPKRDEMVEQLAL